MRGLKAKLEDAAVRLREAKRQVDIVQAEFDDLFKRAVAGGKSSARAAKSQDSHLLLPVESVRVLDRVIDRVDAVLAQKPTVAYGYQELADAVGTTRDTVRAMLNKLRKLRKAHRSSSGKWKYGPDPKGEQMTYTAGT